MPTPPHQPTSRPALAAAAVLAGVGLQAALPAAAPYLAGAALLAAAAAVLLRRPAAAPNPLRLLEAAVVHARDALVILEPHPRPGRGRAVVYANDAFCRLTGYTRDEVLGRSLHFLRGPESDQKTLDAIRAALDEQRPLRIELRNYRKDGSEFWVDLNLVPIPDPAGRPAHWAIIQRDVTDRKAAEAAVRAGNQLLRAIIDAFPGIINAKDAAGRYLVMNRFQADLLGVSAEEAVGKTPADFLGPRYAEAAGAWDLEVLAGGRAVQFEEVYPPGPRGRPLVTTKAPLGPETGATGVVCVSSDVGPLKAAQDALRRSEALFRGIFEGASAGVTLTDPGGRFVACNPAFAALVGRPAEALLALSPADVTHPDDWAAQTPLMDEVRAGTRDRYSTTKRYVRPDGTVVWSELSFAAVRDPDGGYEYGLGVSVDVTDRKRLEEHLLQAHKLEAVGQMAGGVAHDFNNILTAILGKLALIDLPPGDPNRPHLVAVERAAARAADLTGKLLGYARKNQLVSAAVHPGDAFAEAVGLIGHALGPRVRVDVRVADDCGPVRADPTLLSQVLLNLCLNARDAMPDGGTLTLAADPVEVTEAEAAGLPGEARAGRFVRLRVADTGCGMTDEVRARIFEPFFTTKGVGKGTGLGLPMAHGIVKQHRGWVTCESAPGAGTRLDLYLPPADGAAARRPDRRPSPPLADGSRTPCPLPAVPTAPDPADPARRTVLVVDDEEMILEIARAVLEPAGFAVLTAADGAEAVEVFERTGGVDLVVLDVTMPRLSGRDAYRRLVEIDPAARVLFSTGYSADEIAELNGALGLLGKPYRPHELLAAVRDALAGSPARAAG
jgi:PAS domain S-box-containing protein